MRKNLRNHQVVKRLNKEMEGNTGFSWKWTMMLANAHQEVGWNYNIMSGFWDASGITSDVCQKSFQRQWLKNNNGTHEMLVLPLNLGDTMSKSRVAS